MLFSGHRNAVKALNACISYLVNDFIVFAVVVSLIYDVYVYTIVELTRVKYSDHENLWGVKQIYIKNKFTSKGA